MDPDPPLGYKQEPIVTSDVFSDKAVQPLFAAFTEASPPPVPHLPVPLHIQEAKHTEVPILSSFFCCLPIRRSLSLHSTSYPDSPKLYDAAPGNQLPSQLRDRVWGAPNGCDLVTRHYVALSFLSGCGRVSWSR